MNARNTLALATLGAGLLASSAGADLNVTWYSVDGGGALAASAGSFTLGGSVGQHDASNTANTGGYTMTGGYWAAAMASCPSDFDGSGFVDLDDFISFVAAFEAGTDDADFDHTGFVDLDDFIAFVQAFESGC